MPLQSYVHMTMFLQRDSGHIRASRITYKARGFERLLLLRDYCVCAQSYRKVLENNIFKYKSDYIPTTCHILKFVKDLLEELNVKLSHKSRLFISG